MSSNNGRSANPYTLHHGDCLDVLRQQPSGHFAAVLSDPPAGIGFMGKPWDSHSRYEPRTSTGQTAAAGLSLWVQAGMMQPWEAGFVTFMTDVFSEVHRLLIPGGHGLIWSLPRTNDLTTLALRLAGFDIRDVVAHLFGSGFPKSLDISKAIDKAAGAEREVVGVNGTSCDMRGGNYRGSHGKERLPNAITAPATPLAHQFNGYGTALKPAHEDWVLIMKPTSGSFAHNAATHGLAGINVDGARVELIGIENHKTPAKSGLGKNGIYGKSTKDYLIEGRDLVGYTSNGRFPANLITDGSEEVTAVFPDARSGYGRQETAVQNHGKPNPATWGTYGSRSGLSYADGTCSAARFFYTAKPHKRERDAGLGNNEWQTVSDGRAKAIDNPFQRDQTPRRNAHPTVKPIELTKYLATLLLPPACATRRLLVPFSGSGSELIGGLLAGWDEVVGIEMDGDHLATAAARLSWWQTISSQLHSNDVGKILAYAFPEDNQPQTAVSPLTDLPLFAGGGK